MVLVCIVSTALTIYVVVNSKITEQQRKLVGPILSLWYISLTVTFVVAVWLDITDEAIDTPNVLAQLLFGYVTFEFLAYVAVIVNLFTRSDQTLECLFHSFSPMVTTTKEIAILSAVALGVFLCNQYLTLLSSSTLLLIALFLPTLVRVVKRLADRDVLCGLDNLLDVENEKKRIDPFALQLTRR